MSVFRNIMSRIFKGSTLAPSSAQAAEPPAGEAGQRGGAGMPSAPAETSGAAQPGTMPQQPSPVMAQAGAGQGEKVDVEAVLSGMAARNPQKLNWQTSIVDLMKLLDLDSSLSARKELAQELGYTGSLDGSAEMNIWLHRQVMRKLEENGGRVPDSLKG
jgi:hypothetical protein